MIFREILRNRKNAVVGKKTLFYLLERYEIQNVYETDNGMEILTYIYHNCEVHVNKKSS